MDDKKLDEGIALKKRIKDLEYLKEYYLNSVPMLTLSKSNGTFFNLDLDKYPLLSNAILVLCEEQLLELKRQYKEL